MSKYENLSILMRGKLPSLWIDCYLITHSNNKIIIVIIIIIIIILLSDN